MYISLKKKKKNEITDHCRSEILTLETVNL